LWSLRPEERESENPFSIYLKGRGGRVAKKKRQADHLDEPLSDMPSRVSKHSFPPPSTSPLQLSSKLGAFL
jgi:hypothetical protein